MRSPKGAKRETKNHPMVLPKGPEGAFHVWRLKERNDLALTSLCPF